MNGQLFGQNNRDKTSLVFRPGGVQQGNIYTSWSSLMNARSNLTQGSATIYIDSSLGAATIPAGAYDLTGVTLAGAGTGATVAIPVGVTWTNLRRIANLTMNFSTTSPVETISATSEPLVIDTCNINVNGAGVVWDFTTAGQNAIQIIGGSWSTSAPGVNLALNCALGNTLFIAARIRAAGAAAFPAGLISNSGTIFFLTDGTVTPPTIPGTSTVVRLSGSPNLNFTPTTAGQWSTAPTTVQQALDTIAGATLTAFAVPGVFNFASATAYEITPALGANTFSISNLAEGQSVGVALVSPGAYTITWSSPIKWTAATPPTTTATVGRVDLYTFTKINGIVYGAAVLDMG